MKIFLALLGLLLSQLAFPVANQGIADKIASGAFQIVDCQPQKICSQQCVNPSSICVNGCCKYGEKCDYIGCEQHCTTEEYCDNPSTMCFYNCCHYSTRVTCD